MRPGTPGRAFLVRDERMASHVRAGRRPRSNDDRPRSWVEDRRRRRGGSGRPSRRVDAFSRRVLQLGAVAGPGVMLTDPGGYEGGHAV